MHRNFYNIEIPYREGLLLYNTSNQAFVYLEPDYKKFYLNPNLWRTNPAKLEEFKRLGFILDDDVDERAVHLRNFNFVRWKSDKLHITIVPTGNCNFRCSYCFVDFSKPKSMKEQHIPLLVEYILRKIQELGEKFLELNIFGGEPLLKKDFIVKVCDELNKQIPPHVEWVSSMFTNGYLLTSKVLKILQMNCRLKWVQITLDGPPELHDKLRPLRNGGKTFERIFENLKDIAPDSSLTINLRVNVSEENINAIDKLLNLLQPLLKTYTNVKLNFSPVFKTPCNSWRELEEDWRRFSEYMVDRILPSLIKSNVPYDYFPEPIAGPCAAVSPYAYVIDADLSIKKCLK